jgi:hypothetical protein
VIFATTPALPLHEAGKYVASAYMVLFVIVLIYVAIMAVRLSRIERELGGLLELADRDRQPPPIGDAAGTGVGSPEDAGRAESTLA